MREKIFKAKRKNWKELPKEQWWVEGAIFEGKENSYIITNVKVTDEWEDSEIGADVIGYLVDPETICEPTGMIDKNEKKIFDGDIIKIHQFLFDGSEYEKEITVSVEYMSELACFGANLLEAKEIKRYMGYTNDEDTEKVVIPINDFYGLHEESFEVIGNIFDNPELI